MINSVTTEINPAYANILVRCPMPGREHEPAQALGEFIQTEVGQRVLGPSLANVEVLTATGMSEANALKIALGAAVMTDDKGELVRASSELAPAQPTPGEPANAKKKVDRPEKADTALEAYEQLAKTDELLETVVTPDIANTLAQGMEQQAIANALAAERLAASEKQSGTETLLDMPDALQPPTPEPSQVEAVSKPHKEKLQATYPEAAPIVPVAPDEAVPEAESLVVHLQEVTPTALTDIDTIAPYPIAEESEAFDQMAEVDADAYKDAFIGAMELEAMAEEPLLGEEEIAQWIDIPLSEDRAMSVEIEANELPSTDIWLLEVDEAKISTPNDAIIGQLETQLGISLDPEDASATMALIDSLSEAVEEAQKIGNTLGEKQLIVTEQIQELSMQLFDLLGIEYNQGMIERFVQSIIRNEFAAAANTKEQSLELLNTIGTHEYMLAGHRSITDGIVQFLGQKILPPALLGKYALAA